MQEIQDFCYFIVEIHLLIKYNTMRKADLINNISEKTGIPKVDVLVTLETMFKEVKENLSNGENIYIRGFGSFITKKRAAKIGRNIKKNTAVHIPEHYIPAFKPAKEFVHEVKKLQSAKPVEENFDDETEDSI
ncbi:MAG: HU family DNA-binding protein [Agriterribacter sp.]